MDPTKRNLRVGPNSLQTEAEENQQIEPFSQQEQERQESMHSLKIGSLANLSPAYFTRHRQTSANSPPPRDGVEDQNFKAHKRIQWNQSL
jgi:hypothetical protein